jgi:hypothetical protein
MTTAPGGGAEGLAGLLRLTLTEPLTTNSRPSRPSESFGSERYASGLPAHVFHGTLIEAFEPLAKRRGRDAELRVVLAALSTLRR